MENQMVNAVEKWLEKIMPAVVETLSMNWTEEVLHKMGEETGPLCRQPRGVSCSHHWHQFLCHGG